MTRPQLRAALLSVLLVASCAMHNVHPGSVNRADSSAYDVLLISQAVIDQARVELGTGTLPDTLRPGLQRLVESYNTARTSWLTYRNAVLVGQATDAGGMNRAITALSIALDAFQRSRPIS